MRPLLNSAVAPEQQHAAPAAASHLDATTSAHVTLEEQDGSFSARQHETFQKELLAAIKRGSVQEAEQVRRDILCTISDTRIMIETPREALGEQYERDERASVVCGRS